MPPIVRLTLFCLLVAAVPGHAQVPSAAVRPGAEPATSARAKPTRNLSFYNAEMNLASTNPAERRGATIRALAQVLVRLTGNPQAGANAVVRRASASLDALVVESDVRQDQQTVNGMPVYRSVLSVKFDPDSVDALIAAAGLRFWTSTRPKPILWLAIDDGRGPRLVTGQQTNVVKPLATRGLERGMRYLLPAGSAVEQAAVSSIWSLNAAALQVLTARYKNDAQLLGKVYRKPPGWAADWVLTRDGAELARWSFADADPRKVIASGVDEGANAIAKRDSVLLDTGASGPQLADIDGVSSQRDYLRVMADLQSMAVVRRVTVVEARPGQLRVQLDLAVGMKGFLPLVANGGVLQATSDGSGSVARFSLQ